MSYEEEDTCHMTYLTCMHMPHHTPLSCRCAPTRAAASSQRACHAQILKVLSMVTFRQ